MPRWRRLVSYPLGYVSAAQATTFTNKPEGGRMMVLWMVEDSSSKCREPATAKDSPHIPSSIIYQWLAQF